MAEVPEEVTVVLDAEDRASPKITNVGRGLVMLAANISYVTRALGIQSPVIDAVVQGIMLIGHVARAAAAAKNLLAFASTLVASTQAAETTQIAAGTFGNFSYAISAGVAAGATYTLAGAIATLKAVLGDPTALLMLLGAVAGVGVIGYGIGRSSSAPGRISEPVGGGSSGITIHMGNVSMRTRQDIEETVSNLGTHINMQMRRYR